MFRITRGHHVQHIHFPLPVIRDLDAFDEKATRENAAPEAVPPVAAQDGTAEVDASTDAQ